MKLKFFIQPKPSYNLKWFWRGNVESENVKSLFFIELNRDFFSSVAK